MNVISLLTIFVYLFIACESREPTSTTVTTSRRTYIKAILGVPTFRYSGCGVPSEEYGDLRVNGTILKILGGRRSARADWPWMVYIYGRTAKLVCGGTLLDNRWVLTSASCLAIGRNPGDYRVILGRYEVSNTFGVQKRVNVRSLLVHPLYHDGLRGFQNDAAMMQLEERINFTRYIRPACLPEYGSDVDNARGHNSMAGKTCTVLGWGITREQDLNSLPNTLIELSVPIYSDVECRNLTNLRVRPRDSRFCAGGRLGQGTCYGDAGGPLLCLNKERNYYVQGIVSSGSRCGEENVPDVYTDVGHLLINVWIRGVLLHP